MTRVFGGQRKNRQLQEQLQRNSRSPSGMTTKRTGNSKDNTNGSGSGNSNAVTIVGR
jgi:hypothetical protein